VPARTASHPGTTRVFYEVVGDKLDEAGALGQSRRALPGNNLDRTANLRQDGAASVRPDEQVAQERSLGRGQRRKHSNRRFQGFFRVFRGEERRARQTVVVKDGDPMGSLARARCHAGHDGAHQQALARRGLKPGETIVVYSKKSAPAKPSKATATDLYADDQPSAPDIDTTQASTLQ
jgi:hypothetical protein